MADGSNILARVCAQVDAGRIEVGAAILRSDYPFARLTNSGRRYSALECTGVFVRDGFIDRYSGRRLVFPGALRLLSQLYPSEFPFQNNWKTDACHFAFYELFPTIDHVVPVSRGGPDGEENWVSTSMLRNAAKSNFTLDELGWSLAQAGDPEVWDGLMSWFLRQIDARPELAGGRYLRRWADAARRVRRSHIQSADRP
jgi:hypothetical protein